MCMNSNKEITDELIVKYLSGDASPEEAMEIVDWLREPSSKVRFEYFEKSWNASAAKAKPKFNEQKAWSKIGSRIETGKRPQGNQVQLSWWATKSFKIAASLLLVAVSAILVKLNLPDNTKYTVLTTQSETKSVILTDQSEITLFRFSSIEYPAEFSKKNREIIFSKGEAFFQITHDHEKPFVIHTPTVSVRVIGTEFNVAVTRNQTEVSVKEGKVLVYNASDSTYLTGGLNGVFNQGKKINVVDNAIDNNVWSYATHKLTFKNTPLKSVIKDLEKAFSCTISATNEDIGKCKLTATFENDSVDKIITLIAETLSLRVKRNGEVYILEGEGCP